MENYIRVYTRREQIKYVRNLQSFLYNRSREYYTIFLEKDFDRSIQRTLSVCNGKIADLTIQEREESYKEVHLNIDALLPIYISEERIEFRERIIPIYDPSVEIIETCGIKMYRYRLNSTFDLLIYNDVVVFLTQEGYREWLLDDFDQLNKYWHINNSSS